VHNYLKKGGTFLLSRPIELNPADDLMGGKWAKSLSDAVNSLEGSSSQCALSTTNCPTRCAELSLRGNHELRYVYDD